MIIHKFDLGSWSEHQGIPDWTEGTNFDDWLKLTGFVNKRLTLGDPDGAFLTVYGHPENTIEFLIESCFDSSEIDYIFAPNFPSMMVFLKDYSHIVFGVNEMYYINDATEIAHKSFQAAHGHSPYSICERCSPDEYRRMKERVVMR